MRRNNEDSLAVDDSIAMKCSIDFTISYARKFGAHLGAMPNVL